MKEITTEKELQEALKKPLLIIFKHSTQCHISAVAEREMQKFLAVYPSAPLYLVDVIAASSIAQAIALHTGVLHESPQILVLQEGIVIWHASHYDVRAENVEQALVEFR
jgi:bacillithiol system protein YtxJ